MRSFLEVHAPLICRLARLSVRVPSDANDVAQDVMASLLKQHAEGRFDPHRIENAEAFLRVVVRNRARTAGVRASRAHGDGDDDLEGVPTSAPTPEEATGEARDARRFLERIKSRLRPRDALAFALLVEDGLEIESVAQAMGTTANNVYQMRHRILAVSREVHSELAMSTDAHEGPA